MKRNLLAASTLVSLALVLGACGSSSKSSTSTSTSAPTDTTMPVGTTAPTSSAPAIMIENDGSTFKFVTSPVQAGATVTVKNNTAVQHTVSASTTAGGFDMTVDARKTVTFTAPSKPGTYAFHCNIHTNMMGTLSVT